MTASGSIDFSTYVEINSNVQNPTDTRKVFAGLALTSSTLIPTTQPLQQFTSYEDVGAYFGLNSTEYAGAVKYFTSYTNAKQRPPYIYFAKFIVAAVAPFLNSGVITDTDKKLLDLTAITDGTTEFGVNGILYEITGVDFSSATSLSQVASILTTAITTQHAPLLTAGYAVTYDSVRKIFVAAIPGTGSTKTLGFYASEFSMTLSDTLGFTAATGAIISQGANAMNISDTLDDLEDDFTDQFCIFFANDLGGLLTDDINLQFAKWVSDKSIPTPKYNSLIWSNEVALESATDTTSIKYKLDQQNINNASPFDEVLYNNAERVFAYAGVCASVDYSQNASAITTAFKSQPSLLPSVTSTKIAKILNNKKINYYGKVKVSGGSQLFFYFFGGYATGLWAYTDNIMAQVYINFLTQTNLISIFTNTPQVGSDLDGDGKIKSAILQAAQACVDNGIIAKGIAFSDIEQLEIRSNYGANPSELTNNGYIILKDADTSFLRKNRISSDWSLLYVKKSAVQYVPIDTDTYF